MSRHKPETAALTAGTGNARLLFLSCLAKMRKLRPSGLREWRRDGKSHREDGPAVEWSGGARPHLTTAPN
jgi:hypothetical protein